MSIYICEDCGNRFSQMDQALSEYKFGQCPGCLSENIKEEKGEIWRKLQNVLKHILHINC